MNVYQVGTDLREGGGRDRAAVDSGNASASLGDFSGEDEFCTGMRFVDVE